MRLALAHCEQRIFVVQRTSEIVKEGGEGTVEQKHERCGGRDGLLVQHDTIWPTRAS